MHSQIEVKMHRTKSQEIQHSCQFSISLRRDIIYYSQRKKQNLLKYSILGGPNQEYYQKQIRKANRRLEEITYQQNKLWKQFEMYEEELEKLSQKLLEISKQVIGLQHHVNKLNYRLKINKNLQPNEENKIIELDMTSQININKRQIQDLVVSKNLVEFKITYKKSQLKLIEKRLNDLRIQENELRKNILKLQNSIMLGFRLASWTNMK